MRRRRGDYSCVRTRNIVGGGVHGVLGGVRVLVVVDVFVDG